MKRGLFITAEGMDGSGKSTQIRLMEAHIRQKGREVIMTREPGGTNIGEKIRSIILDPENTEMGKMTEMILYAAARAQLVEEVIKPAVENGKIVICDRFIDSSYAYQGSGRGIDMDVINDVNRAAINGLLPDITFFFDIDPEIALNRRISATGADRIEKEKIDFHLRVHAGYKKLALSYPNRIRSIDGSRPVEEIFEDVRQILDEMI